MRLRPSITAVLAALPFVACAPAGPSAGPVSPAPAAASSGAVREQDVRMTLTALADDSMQGRGTGMPGSAMAARFIAGQMRQIGLEAAGDSGYFQRVPLRVQPGMGLRGVHLGTSLHQPAGADGVPVTGVNVVGVLRGADPVLRDSVILVDAHYDHLGIGRPVDGDSIYNGADDDASGVTAVLEIARAMAAGPRPKRTILFVATTGEEVGLLGTQWFIAHPTFPISSIEANMEVEMIGRADPQAGGPGKGWLTGFERSTMGQMLREAGIPLVPDPRPEQHFFERSDNIAFARLGIPAHTLSTFNLHSDYHTPRDESSRIDFAHMTAVIDAAARAVRLLADGHAPQWVPGGRPAPM
jgi:hypothetical protein